MPRSRLTPVEWEIMEVVWKHGGSPSVRDVLETAFPDGEKAYTTIQTMMNTLEKKGYLAREKIGLVNFYTPVKSRKQVIKTEMTSFVSRIFDGSVPALANYLIDTEEMTLDEIREIKTLLLQKEKELKGSER